MKALSFFIFLQGREFIKLTKYISGCILKWQILLYIKAFTHYLNYGGSSNEYK